MDRGDILFEVICPPITWSEAKKEDFMRKICKIMISRSLKYLNLPHIAREGHRVYNFSPKQENYIFAREITEYCKVNFNYNIEPIINIVVPIMDRKKFFEHFGKVYDLGYKNFIFVGKDRSDIEYPGYEVTEACFQIKNRYPDVKIGGIVIFHRENEIKRILKKIESGMDFFVSQIIYDTFDLKMFVDNLKELELFIYVSIAPLSSKRDVEFVKWLGVNLKKVRFDQEDIQNQSLGYIRNVIADVLQINLSRDSKVFLGFNITYNNLEISDKVIGLVSLSIENLRLLKRKPLFRFSGI